MWIISKESMFYLHILVSYDHNWQPSQWLSGQCSRVTYSRWEWLSPPVYVGKVTCCPCACCFYWVLRYAPTVLRKYVVQTHWPYRVFVCLWQAISWHSTEGIPGLPWGLISLGWAPTSPRYMSDIHNGCLQHRIMTAVLQKLGKFLHCILSHIVLNTF